MYIINLLLVEKKKKAVVVRAKEFCSWQYHDSIPSFDDEFHKSQWSVCQDIGDENLQRFLWHY